MNNKEIADEFLFLSERTEKIAQLIYANDLHRASYVLGQMSQRYRNLAVEFTEKHKNEMEL